jgi:hypothetical protein
MAAVRGSPPAAPNLATPCRMSLANGAGLSADDLHLVVNAMAAR